MKAAPKFSFMLLSAMLLCACASAPKFDTNNINLNITPQQALVETTQLQGTAVLWGGVIIASSNLKQATQFEILAYPLDSKQRPDPKKTPQGRFLALQPGYLETSDYNQGRLISLSGTLQQNRTGRVGETEYTYPVIEIRQLHLWPKRSESPDTRFHFGIGVMFSK